MAACFAALFCAFASAFDAFFAAFFAAFASFLAAFTTSTPAPVMPAMASRCFADSAAAVAAAAACCSCATVVASDMLLHRVSPPLHHLAVSRIHNRPTYRRLALRGPGTQPSTGGRSAVTARRRITWHIATFYDSHIQSAKTTTGVVDDVVMPSQLACHHYARYRVVPTHSPAACRRCEVVHQVVSTLERESNRGLAGVRSGAVSMATADTSTAALAHGANPSRKGKRQVHVSTHDTIGDAETDGVLYRVGDQAIVRMQRQEQHCVLGFCCSCSCSCVRN